jgi:hypothetical protein
MRDWGLNMGEKKPHYVLKNKDDDCACNSHIFVYK